MPKIDKKTIKLLPKIRSLKIYKKENLPNYYCSFYVGSNIMKSGNKEISLKTSNVKDALKKAPITYNNFYFENEREIIFSQIVNNI